MGFAMSLAGLVAYTSSRGCPRRPQTELTLRMGVAESSVIHGNRAAIVKDALAGGWTHLLFLDHDMVFEPHIADVLLSRRQPVVVTNYLMKAAVPEFVAVDLDGKRVVTDAHSTGLLPISYSGFGVSLFETKVFERTPKPWFLPEYEVENDLYTTEDNPCFRRIRDAGYTILLDQDASRLITGHIGQRGWAWPEYARPADRPACADPRFNPIAGTAGYERHDDLASARNGAAGA